MLKLEFYPTEKHIVDIKNWLIEEWNKTHNGFYCNWNIISKRFDKKNVILITDNNFPVGFLVYSISDFLSVIDIVEVKPSERNRGIAKKLINETLEYFKLKGVLVCELFCSPENSEPFWKRIGFKNFPDFPYDSKLSMFKPLVESLKPTENGASKKTISLWNCEPYQVKDKNPIWIWNLDFMADGETLRKPIIFPAFKDWYVKFSVNDEIKESEQVKRFPFKIRYSGSFMIIRRVEQ